MRISRDKMKTIVLHMFRVKKHNTAFELAQRVDRHLERQTFHFHSGGKLLTKFDEVIQAILAGELDEETIPAVVI
jgi:hypothetical protein